MILALMITKERRHMERTKASTHVIGSVVKPEQMLQFRAVFVQIALSSAVKGEGWGAPPMCLYLRPLPTDSYMLHVLLITYIRDRLSA